MPKAESRTTEKKLAGGTLAELRRRYHDELFRVVIPFWDRCGFDAEHGGFMCALDYDGTRRNTEKFLWFQGRGIWVYSFLYNHFGRDPRHLEVARHSKEFLLRAAPQPDGWWAESLTREGRVLKPFSGDVYGMYFAAEGLQEYAWASGDDRARALAFELLRRLWRHIDRPDVRLPGTGAPGARPQGLWIVNLCIATQMLRRWQDAGIAGLADRSVDAIINRHYDPEIGLNTEVLDFDFSRPPEQARICHIGHSIEALWMVMEEAERRGDRKLWDLSAKRIRRHLDAGWDKVYGGLSHAINAGCLDYEWPPERPVGTDLEFRFTGEYHHMKALWALNEALIAALMVFERTGAPWAARYIEMAQRVIDEKFSMRGRGLPGSMLFADRQMTPQEHVTRQDNYHPPRQLMLCLLMLDRMMGRSAA